MHIATKVLAKRLGVPVIATAATMGYGIAPLFAAAVDAARRGVCPLPLTPSPHLLPHLEPLAQGLRRREVSRAFRVPLPFLVNRIAEQDRYFSAELVQHFRHQA